MKNINKTNRFKYWEDQCAKNLNVKKEEKGQGYEQFEEWYQNQDWTEEYKI